MSDPVKYDFSEFANVFAWGLIHWNSAEASAKLILAYLLGGTREVLAVVADLGNRNILHGIESACRELQDEDLKKHILHFRDGFSVILGYRNLYVHGLRSVEQGGRVGNTVFFHGGLASLKSQGRLKTVNRAIELKEITEFLDNCRNLNVYGSFLLDELAKVHPELRVALGTPLPLLQIPVWPACLQNTPNYLQA